MSEVDEVLEFLATVDVESAEPLQGDVVHRIREILAGRGSVLPTKDTPDREELAQLILKHFHSPNYTGGSWTLRPYEAADAVRASYQGKKPMTVVQALWESAGIRTPIAFLAGIFWAANATVYPGERAATVFRTAFLVSGGLVVAFCFAAIWGGVW